jgi:Mrp family chromosome partitioning ATPase
MQQLNADLAGLKKQISAEVAKVVDSLEKEAKVAGLRVDAVQKDIAKVKTRVVDTGPDEVKLRQLQTEAQSKRAELERLQSQFEANRAKADSRAVPIEAKIVSRARAASVPVFPRKGPFAALAAFATFLLGLAFTITRALLAGARPGTGATGRSAMRAEPTLAPSPDTAMPRSPAQRYIEVADEFEDLPELAPAAASSKRDMAPDTEPSTSARQPARPTDVDTVRVSTIGALARRVCTQADGGGYRTLVAGETDMMGISSHAIELAKALTELGQSVILLDWAPEGDGIAHALSLPPGPGVAELLNGAATFEQIIRRIPGSEAHVIGAGTFENGDAFALDQDRLNLVLDALDEAYDQVIVAARNEPARAFFEVIEGRVDCGVLVADPGRVGSVHRDLPGSYLGFEVAEIDLVRYDRQVVAATGQRIIRTGRGTPEAAAS